MYIEGCSEAMVKLIISCILGSSISVLFNGGKFDHFLP